MTTPTSNDTTQEPISSSEAGKAGNLFVNILLGAIIIGIFAIALSLYYKSMSKGVKLAGRAPLHAAANIIAMSTVDGGVPAEILAKAKSDPASLSGQDYLHAAHSTASKCANLQGTSGIPKNDMPACRLAGYIGLVLTADSSDFVDDVRTYAECTLAGVPGCVGTSRSGSKMTAEAATLFQTNDSITVKAQAASREECEMFALRAGRTDNSKVVINDTVVASHGSATADKTVADACSSGPFIVALTLAK